MADSSGGGFCQTGVVRLALDEALSAGFPCSGGVSTDRIAKDGVIPQSYPLVAVSKGGYRQQTLQNAVDSDGTALTYYESLKGGTRLKRNWCALEQKPYVLVDARR
jgi:hypothetical protein